MGATAARLGVVADRAAGMSIVVGDELVLGRRVSTNFVEQYLGREPTAGRS